METKKSLGQHFLTNENVAIKIVSLLKDEPIVVEIGGGKGALTKKLIELKKAKIIVVIEIDDDMLRLLKRKFEREGNLHLVKGDGRDIKIRKECVVCGNLPYNTAKVIIRNFVMQYAVIKRMIFMVQKEVADIITAKSGTKNFNKFSVLCQIYFHVKKLFDVKPGSFIPKPKVDSTVVEFKRKNTIPHIDESFFSFLNKLFSHPRKTIKNNLNIELDEGLSKKRPSDLTLDEIQILWSKKWQKR